MTSIAYTAAQKNSLIDQTKRWTENMVEKIMSDDFEYR